MVGVVEVGEAEVGGVPEELAEGEVFPVYERIKEELQLIKET